MSRRQAVVASAEGLVPFGHLGWGYRDRADFFDRAAEYIAEGLRHNQWVEYVGDGNSEELRADVAALPGLPDVGDVKVSSALAFYGVPAGTDIVDPDVAVAHRVAAVERAIKQGYTGFRAVVDATSVARRPEQRDAFARFEFLIDQKMAVLPVSALCAYHLSELADDVSALLCLHPFVNRAAPSFRLYAEPGVSFALSGQVDAAGRAAFASVLHRIPSLTERRVVVDARGLEFISPQQMLALDRSAHDSGAQVVLLTRQPIPARLAELLELTNVRVQSPDDHRR